MTDPDTNPARVGQQLAQRREDLNLTQEGLGQRIGITSFAVSAAERGRNEIRRSKRSDWERALGLRPGTLSRAYRDGSPIEVDQPPAEQPAEPELDDLEERLLRDPEARAAIRTIIERSRALQGTPPEQEETEKSDKQAG